MVFIVQKRCSDTCGNSWYDEAPMYIEANSLQDVREIFPYTAGLGGYDVEELHVQRLESFRVQPSKSRR